jgi:hypothetical protein
MRDRPQCRPDLESALVSSRTLAEPLDQARLVHIVRREQLERIGRRVVQRGRSDDVANRVKVALRAGGNRRGEDGAGHNDHRE